VVVAAAVMSATMSVAMSVAMSVMMSARRRRTPACQRWREERHLRANRVVSRVRGERCRHARSELADLRRCHAVQVGAVGVEPIDRRGC